MARGREKVDETKKFAKRYVRYKEGCEIYSMGMTKFQQLAKEAKAVIKLDKMVLVDCVIFEKYIDGFREWQTIFIAE